MLVGVLPVQARRLNVSTQIVTSDAVGGYDAAALPFDPMTFESPHSGWGELGKTRWWAILVAQVVVRLGIVGTEYSPRLVELTEGLMHHPELDWQMRLGRAQKTRLNFQLKAAHGGPRAGVLFRW